MRNLEVIARMKIRPGALAGFTSQVDEILCATHDKDTDTIRCDFFVDANGTECEVHEAFSGERALIEHKMNTMEATVVLFRDYASDHHATIFGDVSQGFIDMATERMGPPTIYSFVQGLQAPTTADDGSSHIEVIARMAIRPGQLEGFHRQAAELIRLTEEFDTRTLRYDWFIDGNGTECEVHEAYLGSGGLVEHNTHIMEARAELFRQYACDHRMSAYGELSEQLRELGKRHAADSTSSRSSRGSNRPPPSRRPLCASRTRPAR
jgi:quinol monooxygenase YgiN